jgi:hypothetical protein
LLTFFFNLSFFIISKVARGAVMFVPNYAKYTNDI